MLAGRSAATLPCLLGIALPTSAMTFALRRRVRRIRRKLLQGLPPGTTGTDLASHAILGFDCHSASSALAVARTLEQFIVQAFIAHGLAIGRFHAAVVTCILAASRAGVELRIIPLILSAANLAPLVCLVFLLRIQRLSSSGPSTCEETHTGNTSRYFPSLSFAPGFASAGMSEMPYIGR